MVVAYTLSRDDKTPLLYRVKRRRKDGALIWARHDGVAESLGEMAGYLFEKGWTVQPRDLYTKATWGTSVVRGYASVKGIPYFPDLKQNKPVTELDAVVLLGSVE